MNWIVKEKKERGQDSRCRSGLPEKHLENNWRPNEFCTASMKKLVM